MTTDTSTTDISTTGAPTADPREAGVLEAIDAIRPALQADGGDIVFSNIDAAGVVHVELVGACGTCPISTQTLKAGVERIIMDRVPGVTEVVAD
jgi:Fe-S cluster biogenesis protein NfuA